MFDRFRFFIQRRHGARNRQKLRPLGRGFWLFCLPPDPRQALLHDLSPDFGENQKDNAQNFRENEKNYKKAIENCRQVIV